MAEAPKPVEHPTPERPGVATEPLTKQPTASALPVIDTNAARAHFEGGSSAMTQIVLALCDFYDGAVAGQNPGDR